MNFALIQGEKGFIHEKNGANGCEEVLLHVDDRVISLNAQTNPNRLFYEAEAFQQIIEKKKNHAQCYAWLDESLSVMKVLDAARKDAGIVFPADQI
ncbi:hypothetical protein BsIDN1_69600 [Bacillus safensis]|uniref:Gfo/Idh/MocA-like oxidoreductase C-terminal domain-containing protein n=1 Tax=Bacillus safensis TaxID=561879 RepID=A0A5S9MKY9_BACIA|nr:hypothetical protein BsIDN1_69600 [Bacillus safensis]